MRILLDTCVLSELRRPKGHAAVRRAVEAADDRDLFVSVLSVGEIAKGIGLLKEGERKVPCKAGCKRWSTITGTAFFPSILKQAIFGVKLLRLRKRRAALFQPATDSLRPRHCVTACMS